MMILADNVMRRMQTLSERHRLFVREPGAETLRPAQAADAADVFSRGEGTVFVVSARETRVEESVHRGESTRGLATHQQRVDATSEVTRRKLVAYSAAPVDDIDYLMSFPLEDRRQQPIEGVPCGALTAGLGTVEVENSHDVDGWNLSQEHRWQGGSESHRVERESRHSRCGIRPARQD